MATRLVEIVNTEWTKITTVGDNGTCWKRDDGGIFVCSTDQEGAATLPLSNTNVTLDRAKRVPLDEDSPEVLQLNPLSPDDAFYALSLKDSAQIVIDSLLGNFGPELVTNGIFDADTDWIKGVGWTIAAGVADCDGSQVGNSLLYQGNVVDHTDESKLYKVTFDVTRTAGNWAVWLCNQGYINPSSWTGWQNGSDSYEYNLNPWSTGAMEGRLYIAGNVDFVGTFDNVSTKEYL